MIDNTSARIGILLLELHIPDSQSLKVKRKSILSFKDKVRHTFNVSVAEVDGEDSWQRSVIGVSMVSNEAQILEKSFQSIVLLLDRYPEITLLDARTEIL